MSNSVRDRILRSAIHHITVGAILLLLVNDHVLRHVWPSWLTGKMGDVAWLVFAPLIAAALLSVVMPRRERLVIVSGMVLVGALFTAGKTIPAVREGIVSVLGAVFGRPFQLVVDPTDLMALPALAITWWVWRASQARRRSKTAQGWGWLVVGAVLSIANMGMPNYGISCVYEIDEGILGASAFYPSYFSTDGGRSWQEGWPQAVDYPTVTPCEFDGTLDTPIGVFQFTPHEISRSTDGGQTWESELRIRGSEARYAYYERVRPEAYYSYIDVFDAMYDESTGHIIVAMGQDGILIREADGNWVWVGAGPYVRESLARPDKLLRLLWIEYLISLPLMVMAVHVGGKLAAKHTWKGFEIAKTIFMALLLLTTSVFVPARSWGASDYASPLIVRLLLLLVGAVTLATVPNFVRMLRASPRRQRNRWLITVIGGWVLCALIYAGWGVEIIDQYYASAGLAWLMALGAMLVSWRINPGDGLPSMLPSSEEEKAPG